MTMLTQAQAFTDKMVEVNGEAMARIQDIDQNIAVKQAEIDALNIERDTWAKLSAETVKRYPAVAEAISIEKV
jgi:hypothetical protein